MAEGNDACILPWQRDEIRRRCCEISASVRSRPAYADTKKLTLVGHPDSDFELARELAQECIAENFGNSIKCVDDVPGNIRDVPKAKAATKPPVQPKHPPPHVVLQQQQHQLIAQSSSSSMVAQQQMVAHQQQLVAQQQQMLQQHPSHPLAMQMQQQSMAMMTMMMSTIAQQNSLQGHVLGQPMTMSSMSAAPPGQVQPMGYPDSTPLLRPAERGNKGIIGIHMKQIIWNEE